MPAQQGNRPVFAAMHAGVHGGGLPSASIVAGRNAIGGGER
jgi:hypothetical protein